MRLDSHQHFWEYDPAEYPWITDRLARIRRSFLPTDLEPELTRAGIQERSKGLTDSGFMADIELPELV